MTAHVEADLDRRHSARALPRTAESAGDYRAAWQAIEALWEATLARATHLTEARAARAVDGEWSFVETHRHLLFASDAWLGSAVLEEDAPYHPWGFPAGGAPAETARRSG